MTPREYTLVEALARNEGRVLSRDAIESGSGERIPSFSNTVDVYISHLRKKIGFRPFDQTDPYRSRLRIHAQTSGF